MKFGIFYELQLPRPWAHGDEHRLYQNALDQIEMADRLGYDHAWQVEHHFLEEYSHSPAPESFLAAASQRTRRIELGAAVIQMGYENPFRLAEDLATADTLSRSRLQVGLSAGAPLYGALLGDRFHDGDPSGVDYSHARVLRLRDNLRDERFGDEEAWIESPAGRQRPRLQILRASR